jgi:hypothetical protein
MLLFLNAQKVQWNKKDDIKMTKNIKTLNEKELIRIAEYEAHSLNGIKNPEVRDALIRLLIEKKLGVPVCDICSLSA